MDDFLGSPYFRKPPSRSSAIFGKINILDFILNDVLFSIGMPWNLDIFRNGVYSQMSKFNEEIDETHRNCGHHIFKQNVIPYSKHQPMLKEWIVVATSICSKYQAKGVLALLLTAISCTMLYLVMVSDQLGKPCNACQLGLKPERQQFMTEIHIPLQATNT